MTSSGQLLTRIDASEALTRLQKAADTGDWAELKPEEAQEAADLLVESAALIRELDAQLAAQTEALTPSGDTKGAYMGEFRFEVRGVDEEGEETDIRIDTPWDTIKQIMAAIRARAAATLARGGHE